MSSRSSSPGRSSTLRWRLPYDAEGTFTLSVSLTTAEKLLTLPVTMTVRPLTWQPAAEWDGDNQQGPEAREHPIVWIDQNNPNRLLLFAGLGFVPTQFTFLSDYWALDLALGTWSALASPVACR